MRTRIILFSCLILQSLLQNCVCIPLLTKCDHITCTTILKRNVFMSRGWGANGMNHNMLLLMPQSSEERLLSGPNNYNRLAEERVQDTQSEYVVEDEKIKIPPVAEYLIQQQHQDGGTVARQGDQNIDSNNKKYHILPQLFVSYDWAPIGK